MQGQPYLHYAACACWMAIEPIYFQSKISDQNQNLSLSLSHTHTHTHTHIIKLSFFRMIMMFPIKKVVCDSGFR